MPLPQQYRDILVETMASAFPVPVTGQNFLNSANTGSWNRIAPMNVSFKDALPIIVDTADAEGWLRDLVLRLVNQFSTRPEFAAVLVEIDRAAPVKTHTDPFQEVLLASDRPFVNRRDLRAHLINLLNPAGSSVLLVDGERQTGKSYSFYLINHVAPSKGFVVNRFNMTTLLKADELAGEILRRLKVSVVLPPIGNESALRWGDKLADIVATEVLEKKVPRLFVFDQFPEPSFDTEAPEGFLNIALPDATKSFISRLATYADEELRLLLRIVLMRSRIELPPDLDEVALRDDATPFTNTDMIAVVMQVAKARKWAVTPVTVAAKVDEFHQVPRTLKERFQFLRGLLHHLASSAS